MAIAVLHDITGLQGAGAGSPSTTAVCPWAVGQNVTAGSLLVAFINWGAASGTISSVTDGTNSFTLVPGTLVQANGNSAAVYYCKNATAMTAPTFTCTFTTAQAFPELIVVEVGGIALSAPLDVKATATAASGDASVGPITTTQNNEFIFAGIVCSNQRGSDPASPWTATQTAYQNARAYQIVNATGSYSVGWGAANPGAVATSGSWICIIVSFADTDVGAGAEQLSVASALVTATPLTLAAWLRVTSLASQGGIFSIGNNAANQGFHLYHDTAGHIKAEHQQDTGTAGIATTTATFLAGVWVHVAAVFASTASRSVYLNGVNKVTDTTTISGTLTLNVTYIETFYKAGLQNLNGDTCFSGLWNVALTDTEIAELGAGLGPGRVRPNALLSYLWQSDTAGVERDIVSTRTWTKTGARLALGGPPIYQP